MRRLFLHFYLFMLLVLLGIGWSVERLWQQSQTAEPPGWVVMLGQSLAYQLLQPEVSPEQVAGQLDLPLQTLASDAIAWSDAEQEALERDQLVPLFADNMVYFYRHQHGSDQLLQFGPVEIDANRHQGYLFTLLFFALLAIAVALWLWPLARDIQQLQHQLKRFGQGMQLPEQPLPAHSLVAPIAASVQLMAAQISRLVSLQREMTHAVSHELRTPLARLSFALEMQPIAEADKQAMLQDVHELDQLVDEMLDYARLEAQTVKLQLHQVDIAELCDNLVEKLAPLPGAPVLLQRPPHLLLCCDGHYLERALQNLLVNAKRYGKHQVLLSLQQDGDWVEFSVEDDGPGIPASQRDSILQPFVRLDQSRSKGHGGFGLGLAIVSRIVGWHQGQLTIGDSVLGGARFRLRLPVRQRNNTVSANSPLSET